MRENKWPLSSSTSSKWWLRKGHVGREEGNSPTPPPTWKLLIKAQTAHGIPLAIKVTPASNNDFQTILWLNNAVAPSCLWLHKDRGKTFFFLFGRPSWAPRGHINDKGIIWPFAYNSSRMLSSRKTIRHNWPINTGNKHNNMPHTVRLMDTGMWKHFKSRMQYYCHSFLRQCVSFTALSFVNMYRQKSVCVYSWVFFRGYTDSLLLFSSFLPPVSFTQQLQKAVFVYFSVKIRFHESFIFDDSIAKQQETVWNCQ